MRPATSEEKPKEKLDRVENAVSQSFLEGEWERMHADPAIDFSKIKPDSRFAEICCPFPPTSTKKMSSGTHSITFTNFIFVFRDSGHSKRAVFPRNVATQRL